MTKRVNDEFCSWLDEKGDRWLKGYLGVSHVTLRNWRLGIFAPRVTHMRKIRSLTKGRITYEMMIDRPRGR